MAAWTSALHFFLKERGLALLSTRTASHHEWKAHGVQTTASLQHTQLCEINGQVQIGVTHQVYTHSIASFNNENTVRRKMPTPNAYSIGVPLLRFRDAQADGS